MSHLIPEVEEALSEGRVRPSPWRFETPMGLESLCQRPRSATGDWDKGDVARCTFERQLLPCAEFNCAR